MGGGVKALMAHPLKTNFAPSKRPIDFTLGINKISIVDKIPPSILVINRSKNSKLIKHFYGKRILSIKRVYFTIE